MLISAQRMGNGIHWAAFFTTCFVIYYLSCRTAGDSRDSVDQRPRLVKFQHEKYYFVETKHPFPSPRLVQFWEELLSELLRTNPISPPISEYEHANRFDFDPKAKHPEGHVYQLPDLIELQDADRDSLKAAHNGFVSRIKDMSARLPFERGSRGIVMTARGSNIGMAVTSLLMLRQTGSRLPVQLFLDEATDKSRHVCEQFQGEMNVECFSFDAIFSTTPTMPALSRFQFKVFSVLFSSFQDILFLDADAFPIHDPEYLFRRKPYTSHGLVTWPDFWMPTVSPALYDITSTPAPALSRSSRSSESGIMLYNKARHADSLLLATYYNFYGPHYYYPLLSQGADGEGDKETFLHSALVLGNPAYSVQTNIGAVGRWYNGSFQTSALKQADPADDWRLSNNNNNARGRGGRHSQLSLQAEGDDEVHARCLFIHHNQVKIDVQHMDATLGSILRKNDEGQYVRLWGDEEDFTETAGYDVEKAMWREVLRATCQASFVEECARLRDYFISVFIDMGEKTS
ncbi:mannosyltransferase putative-domain-containing protein [Phialemonium atrogriseum]|uniref:Mannosyltransferase putative-domain-containing protein n=1 Tax=Phialemonium atrogriseum TaxID=1093897 RepID=A0AAJ0C4I7_9PEZI|nr:mannosyltransferase putative-domain-containing protein [Phialemonium atrogriseum]KAK1770004.1 mannosyltransferase putative-domain-containing protein [Phialemonium atrogriseum]